MPSTTDSRAVSKLRRGGSLRVRRTGDGPHDPVAAELHDVDGAVWRDVDLGTVHAVLDADDVVRTEDGEWTVLRLPPAGAAPAGEPTPSPAAASAPAVPDAEDAAADASASARRLADQMADLGRAASAFGAAFHYLSQALATADPDADA